MAIDRRNFLKVMLAACSAPLVGSGLVQAGIIMPVRSRLWTPPATNIFESDFTCSVVSEKSFIQTGHAILSFLRTATGEYLLLEDGKVLKAGDEIKAFPGYTVEYEGNRLLSLAPPVWCPNSKIYIRGASV